MKKKTTALLLSASLLASPMNSLAEVGNEVTTTETVPVIQPQEQYEEREAIEETNTNETSQEVIQKQESIEEVSAQEETNTNEASQEVIQKQESIEEVSAREETEQGEIKNGWVRDNDNVYYYINDVITKGWKYIENQWFYFHEETGVMQTGWSEIEGKWYLFSGEGKMKTGWHYDGLSWYYLKDNGVMVTGWSEIGGKWYLFSGEGKMKTGWHYDGLSWYYLKDNGVMVTGWSEIGGKWYLFSDEGKMKTGWQYNGTAWYYLKDDGMMVTGWYYHGTSWYYFKQDGAMATGWISDGGKWYYLYDDGAMKKGQAYLDAPMIFQLPELKNGCEVVSMTMMLKYHGYNVDKMTLAMQMPLDTTPARTDSLGQIVTWGDPAVGFVGDVKGISKGYSIDPAPLKKVLDRYTNSGIDLTGSDFTSIERLLEQGKPVVTWITASFSHPVAPKSWRTTSGKTIYADFDMHAVLVTGYDDNYVYFNDPLRRGKGAKVSKSKFISSYNYMGKKALSMN